MLILMSGIFDERETACFYCPAAAEKRIYMRTILAVAVFEILQRGDINGEFNLLNANLVAPARR
jgi:hypothetical protein